MKVVLGIGLVAVAVVGLLWTGSLFGSSRAGAGGLGFRGGCCGTLGAGGGAAGAAGGAAGAASLEESALSAYRAETGDQGEVTVRVTDFGCHVQADVVKDGRRSSRPPSTPRTARSWP